MVATPNARRVRFVIAGGSRRPAELSELLHAEPDESSYEGQERKSVHRTSIEKENSWILIESGGADCDVSTLLDGMYERLDPISEQLRSVREDGSTVVLRVVQHVTSDDEMNGGFVLDLKLLSLLAEIGAFFELDLYVED
jgi:hypothetical protein